MCYLYFLQSENDLSRIKIGITSDLKKRLQTHQTSNGHRVYYIHTEKYDTREHAESVAKAIEKSCQAPVYSGTEWVIVNGLLKLYLYQAKKLKGYSLPKQQLVERAITYLIDWNLQISNPYIYICPTVLQRVILSATNTKLSLKYIGSVLDTVDTVKVHHSSLGITPQTNSNYGKSIIGNILPPVIDFWYD
jgi:hypothetical protein